MIFFFFKCVFSQKIRVKNTFFIQKKKGTLWSPFEESYEKARGGKARSFCSSFDLFVPLYPILDFEVIFYHGPSRLPDSTEGMHDNFATENSKTLSCPSRFVLVFLVKVPCLV